MKTVLITNLFMQGYTGSEFQTLDVARLFQAKGYEVTIAVFFKGYPMMGLCDGISIVNCHTEPLPRTEYDIVLIHHFPVFDHLVSTYDIRYRKLVVSRLGILNELEELPACAKDADVVSCVSDETAEFSRTDGGIPAEKLHVFRNCATRDFFDAYQPSQQHPLRKIAIITNHLPGELSEFRQYNQEKWVIQHFGLESTPQLVDEKLLREFDLVISIGRTVQLCFAAGVPVYAYDYFGGPGYITADNIDLAERHNFSGRGFPPKAVAEITDEIEQGYAAALEYLPALHERAKSRYNMELEFEQFYQKIWETPGEQLRSLEYYTSVEKRRVKISAYFVSVCDVFTSPMSQLFFDTGDGFSETKCVSWSSLVEHPITWTHCLDAEVNELRFDPADESIWCRVSKVLINGEDVTHTVQARNSFFHHDGFDLFLTSDPQYTLFSVAEGQFEHVSAIEVEYMLRPVDLDELQEHVVRSFTRNLPTVETPAPRGLRLLKSGLAKVRGLTTL